MKISISAERNSFPSRSRWKGMSWVPRLLPLAILAATLVARPARAEELDPKIKDVVNKGLAWVAKTQHRDGHWDANGGQYPTTMTALGGMVLLLEGSTIKDGKYAENIRKAVDWFL